MKTPWYYPLLALPLSLFSGLILALALPPRSHTALAWVAFVPLLIACRISRPLIAAGCGMLTAAVCGIILAGLVNSTVQYANLVAAFGGLAVVLAFAAGFASVGAKRLSPAVWPFFVACAGVTGELLGTGVFPVNAAISQHGNAGMLRFAAYTGIWGVSFLLWLVPATLIASVKGPKATLPAVVVSCTGLLIAAVVGFPQDHGARTIGMAAVQSQDPYNALDMTNKIARYQTRGLAGASDGSKRPARI